MMSISKYRSLALAGCAAVVLVTAGCTASPTPSTSNPGESSDRMVIDWATGNTTLDPAAACNQDDLSLIHNMYATLTKYDVREGSDGTSEYDPTKIVPALAEDWEVSDDGKTYTFTLPSDAVFSDGSPMDAEAVKYSAERVLDSGTCAAFYLQAGALQPPLIESVEAPDATTVVFELNRPNGDFLAGLATPAGSIVNPAVVEANGGSKPNTPNKYMASNVAGGGAYLLESYSPGDKVVLKANPEYYGEQPATPEIEINYVTEPSNLLLQARSQAADVTLGMPLQSVNTIESDACCRIVTNESPSFAQIALKNTVAPLDDPKVREALTLAVPYEDILKNVAYGYGSLFFGPVVPGAVGHDADGSAPLKTDLDKAKKLIAESGVDGPIELTMIVNTTTPIAVQLATLVQGVWEEIGVKLKVEALPPSEFTPRYTGGDYQLAVNLEGPGVPSAGYQLTLTAQCGNPFNNAEVCVDGADELLEQARTTTDPAEADALYAEITQLWRAQFPRIPVYAAQHVTVLSKDVTHFEYAKFLDFSTWTVSQ